MNSRCVTPDSDPSFCYGKSESFLKLSPIHHPTFKQRLQPKRCPESPVSALSNMPAQSFTSTISPLNLHTLTNDSTAPLDELYVRTERDCNEIEKVMRRYKRPKNSRCERTSSEDLRFPKRKLQVACETIEALRQSMQIMDGDYEFTEVYDEETLCTLFKQATDCLKQRLDAYESDKHDQARAKSEFHGLKQKVLKKEQDVLKLERQVAKSIKTCDIEARKLTLYKASLEKKEKRLEADCEALKMLQGKYEERKKRLRQREIEVVNKEEQLNQLDAARARDKASAEVQAEQDLQAQTIVKAEIDQLSILKTKLEANIEELKSQAQQIVNAKQSLTVEYNSLQSKTHKTTEEVKRLTSKALHTDRQIRIHLEDQHNGLATKQKLLEEKERRLKHKEAQMIKQSTELEKLSHELNTLKSTLESDKKDHLRKLNDRSTTQVSDRALKAAEQQISILEKSVLELRQVVESNEQTWKERQSSCLAREQDIERREAEIKKQQSLLEYAERQLEAECSNIKGLWSQQFDLLYQGYDPLKQ